MDDKLVLGKKLFAEYESLDKKVEATKIAHEEALRERSNIVKSIHDQIGKGPFMFKGSLVKIVIRGDTYFFRGKNKESAMEIE